MLAPSTCAVAGHCPSGSRCTNGSSAYALSYTARAPAASMPGASFAVQVARMPRLIGTRVGVKLTVTG